MNRPISSVHSPSIGMLSNREEMLKLACGGMVGLDIWYASTIDDPDLGRPTIYQWLRHHLGPDAVLGVRMYPEAGWLDGQSRHWCDVAPESWAQECVRRLLEIPGLLDDPNVVVSPFNEPDLENEGWRWDWPTSPSPDDYRFIWAYQGVWLSEIRQRLPSAKVRYGTVPLAGGHEPFGYPPDWEYSIPEAHQAIDAFDVLWLHQYLPREADANGFGWHENNDGYWHGLRALRPAGYREQVQGKPMLGVGPDPGGAMVQYPDKQVLFSEWGNWHHGDQGYADLTLTEFRYCYERYSLTGRVLMLAVFIWDSGDEHAENRLRDNWPLIHGLQDIEYPAADLTTGGGTTMAWDRHKVYDTWQKTFGGQGYNPADAFGKLIAANPNTNYGVFVGNYQAEEPFIYAYTTVGIFCYDKRTGLAVFATSESELPLT